MRSLKATDFKLLTAGHGHPCISLYVKYDLKNESAANLTKRFSALVSATALRLQAEVGKNPTAQVGDLRLLSLITKIKITDIAQHSGSQNGVIGVFVSPAIAGYLVLDQSYCALRNEVHAVGEEFYLEPIRPIVENHDAFVAVRIHLRQAEVFLGNGISFQSIGENVSLKNSSDFLFQLLRPFLERGERNLVLSGSADLIAPIRAQLAEQNFFQGGPHHKTVFQLPELNIQALAHRSRELIKATLRHQPKPAAQNEPSTSAQASSKGINYEPSIGF